MARQHVPLPEEVNVKVVVRVRPPNERERQLGYKKCVSVEPLGRSVTVYQPGQLAISPSKQSLSPPQQARIFTFDYVADEFVTQEEMFASVGKPMAHACLQGYHCCLIAYGQTGAGKTYTMEEWCGSGVLSTVFKFTAIHEDSKIGMYVEGLQEIEVQTPEATYEVLKQGSINRNVGATAMNSESSRSHGVFILIVESQRQHLGVLNRRLSRFYLVDLAGSERQKQTEAAGLRLKESGSINRSLSALGNVIKALLEISEGKIRHIPYRDSKLTYLLKDALGGNSKCTLIANISPSIINIDETISTLKFAQRAKFIQNVAVVNEDSLGNANLSGEEVKRLRLEIAALRARIGSASASDQTVLCNDHSSRMEKNGQEKSQTALKSQVEHLESVNHSLKLELEVLSKEKKAISSEFSEIKRERDQSKKQLASLEEQHIQAFRKFISRPRSVKAQHRSIFGGILKKRHS